MRITRWGKIALYCFSVVTEVKSCFSFFKCKEWWLRADLKKGSVRTKAASQKIWRGQKLPKSRLNWFDFWLWERRRIIGSGVGFHFYLKTQKKLFLKTKTFLSRRKIFQKGEKKKPFSRLSRHDGLSSPPRERSIQKWEKPSFQFIIRSNLLEFQPNRSRVELSFSAPE